MHRSLSLANFLTGSLQGDYRLADYCPILSQAQSIGHLQVGGVADIVVFDPQEQWQVTPEGLHSQGKHTPFGFVRSGMALPGRIKATWVNGHLAFSA